METQTVAIPDGININGKRYRGEASLDIRGKVVEKNDATHGDQTIKAKVTFMMPPVGLDFDKVYTSFEPRELVLAMTTLRSMRALGPKQLVVFNMAGIANFLRDTNRDVDADFNTGINTVNAPARKLAYQAFKKQLYLGNLTLNGVAIKKILNYNNSGKTLEVGDKIPEEEYDMRWLMDDEFIVNRLICQLSVIAGGGSTHLFSADDNQVPSGKKRKVIMEAQAVVLYGVCEARVPVPGGSCWEGGKLSLYFKTNTEKNEKGAVENHVYPEIKCDIAHGNEPENGPLTSVQAQALYPQIYARYQTGVGLYDERSFCANVNCAYTGTDMPNWPGKYFRMRGHAFQPIGSVMQTDVGGEGPNPYRDLADLKGQTDYDKMHGLSERIMLQLGTPF